MTPPTVACVGAGYWGKNLIRNFSALGALHTICDTDGALLDGYAGRYEGVRLTSSLDQVLDDSEVSAVAFATPAETHGELTALALEAGKDVFVEKPLCLDAVEGERLVAYAEDTGRVLMVGHLLRYHPAVVRLKELIDSGELGTMQYIYSNRLNLGKFRRSENILWSFAPHDVSVILGLAGQEPSDVFAVGGNYLHEDIADVTVSHLEFEAGLRAHIFVSWLHPFKEQKLVVVGDEAMAVFSDTSEMGQLVLYRDAVRWEDGLPVPNKSAGVVVDVPDDEPLRLECEHFLGCVVDRGTPLTDGREALRVLGVLQDCQRWLDKPAHAAV